MIPFFSSEGKDSCLQQIPADCPLKYVSEPAAPVLRVCQCNGIYCIIARAEMAIIQVLGIKKQKLRCKECLRLSVKIDAALHHRIFIECMCIAYMHMWSRVVMMHDM